MKKTCLLIYLSTEFSDNNSVLYQIIVTLQDLYGVYQNFIFFLNSHNVSAYEQYPEQTIL